MSAVRMCDRCGTIFSEREDGWLSATGTRVARDDRGRPTTVTEQFDTCSACTNGGNIMQPRLAVTADVERLAATMTQADIEQHLNK